MRIVVFDTETTSLEKPFCYNIGIIGYDTETKEILFRKEWIIEQIWHNLPLFNSAYYAEKRPIYVAKMRGRTAHLDKYGYVMQRMNRLFQNYNIEGAYAFNSDFDKRVFNFNCDWYKCLNPFDTMPIFDIRAYAQNRIAFTKGYQTFCEKNSLFTDSGNYPSTAESLCQYISNNADFKEEHTALNDSQIELEILLQCIARGAKWNEEYKTYRSIPRRKMKLLELKARDGVTRYFAFEGMRWTKNKTKLTLS